MPWSDVARRAAFLARNAKVLKGGTRRTKKAKADKRVKFAGYKTSKKIGAIKEPKHKVYSTAPRKATKGSFTKGDKRFEGIKAKRTAGAKPKVAKAAPTFKPHSISTPTKVQASVADRTKPAGIKSAVVSPAHNKPAAPKAATIGRAGNKGSITSPKPGATGGAFHHFRVKTSGGKTGTASIRGGTHGEALSKLQSKGLKVGHYLGSFKQSATARKAGLAKGAGLQASKVSGSVKGGGVPTKPKAPTPTPAPKPVSTAPGPHQPGVPMGMKIPKTGSNAWAKTATPKTGSGFGSKVKRFGTRVAKGAIRAGAGISKLLGHQKGRDIVWSPMAVNAAKRARKKKVLKDKVVRKVGVSATHDDTRMSHSGTKGEDKSSGGKGIRNARFRPLENMRTPGQQMMHRETKKSIASLRIAKASGNPKKIKTGIEDLKRHRAARKSIMNAKPKLGSGGRFKALKKKLSGHVDSPAAVAASIGRAKYGKKKMAKWAAKGRTENAKTFWRGGFPGFAIETNAKKNTPKQTAAARRAAKIARSTKSLIGPIDKQSYKMLRRGVDAGR